VRDHDSLLYCDLQVTCQKRTSVILNLTNQIVSHPHCKPYITWLGKFWDFALTNDLQSAVIRPVVTVWLTWWNKPSPSYALVSGSFVTSELLCNASVSLYTCKMFAAISVMCLFQLENIPASFPFCDSSCVSGNLLPHAASNFIPSLQLCILNYVGTIKVIASSGNLFSRWHLYTVPAIVQLLI